MTFAKSHIRAVKRSIFSLTVLSMSIGVVGAVFAEPLKPVSGASFDSSVVSWDALDSAIGYNIYLDYEYLDTVVVGTEFTPDQVGVYSITAFDGNGNFSPLEVIEDDIVPTTNSVFVTTIDSTLESPFNVTGLVYSSSAGEIFWEKNNSRRLRYAVEVNGERVGFTSGNSFFITTLSSDTENEVLIVAIDSNDAVSAPVILSFDTRAQQFPQPASSGEASTPTAGPQAPQNATIEEYSSTTAEIFWDRAEPSQNIDFTEVYRNDDLIGVSPGNSFYDDTRSPDTLYGYELRAIDINGLVSESTFINRGPFDSDDETIALSLFAGISEVAKVNPHTIWSPFLSELGFGSAPESLLLLSSQGSNVNGLNVVVDEYECVNGSITVERRPGYSNYAKIVFDDCTVDNTLIFGSVSIEAVGGLSTAFAYDDFFVLDDSDTPASLNGLVTENKARAFDRNVLVYTDFTYELIGNLIDDEGLDTVVVLNQKVSYDGDDAFGPYRFTTNMIASAPWTQGRVLTIDTNEEFVSSATSGGNYVAGSLTVLSDNGDSVSLFADTGDDATWFAEISDSEGTRGVSGAWNELVQLPCIDRDGDDCR